MVSQGEPGELASTCPSICLILLLALIRLTTPSNQRGLVPSINYNGEIITESLVVSQFLADAHPSHLIPPSNGADNALFRARVNFFADTFITKALPHIFNGWKAQTDSEKDEAAEGFVAAVVKELEPLFDWDETKGTFFRGSQKVTLAEVSAALKLRDFTLALCNSPLLKFLIICIGSDCTFRASTSWPQQGRVRCWEPENLPTTQREGTKIQCLGLQGC